MHFPSVHIFNFGLYRGQAPFTRRLSTLGLASGSMLSVGARPWRCVLRAMVALSATFVWVCVRMCACLCVCVCMCVQSHMHMHVQDVAHAYVYVRM